MSVFLVTCAAAVLGATMPVATIGRGKAKYQQHAVNFANKQIELIRTVGYPNINDTKLVDAGVIDSGQEVSAHTYACDNVDQAIGDRISDVVPEGHATVSIEQVDQELKRVTIHVTWTESGRANQLDVGTLVANL
jgi:hypothetical protein